MGVHTYMSVVGVLWVYIYVHECGGGFVGVDKYLSVVGVLWVYIRT